MKKSKVKPTLADKENPSWKKADFAKAKRVEDIPALAHLSRRRPGEREPQNSHTKKPARGTGPQNQINDDLRVAAHLDGL